MNRIKRWRFPIIIVLLFVVFFVVLLVWMRMDGNPNEIPQYNISVVLYGQSSERWLSFDQGLRQACNDLGITKPVILVSGSEGIQEQRRLIQREIDNGAQGLIIAAADSEEMGLFLDVAAARLPVVLVETGTDDLKNPAISADNHSMGATLAERMHKIGAQNVALVVTNLQRDSVLQRYEGFAAQMKEYGIEIVEWDADASATSLRDYVVSALDSAALPDAMVALDNETLDTVLDGLEAAGQYVPLYGVGSSEKVVHALDQGGIRGICFQNEFNIGYMAMVELGKKMKMDTPSVSSPIAFQYVNQENMYDPEIERRLFPIIQ